MALINRFARLFTADFHAVLDRLEEPAILLRHAVREMEDELAVMRGRRLALQGEHDALAERENECRRRLARLDEELDVCLHAGDDELARSVVRRKLETGQALAAIAGRQSSALQSMREIDEAIADGAEYLQATRDKLDVLTATDAERARNPERGCRGVDASEVEVALLREKHRRAQP